MRRMALGLAMAMMASQTAMAGTIGVVRDLGAITPKGISNAGQIVGLSTGQDRGNSVVVDAKTGRAAPLENQAYYAAISSGGTVASRSGQTATIRQTDGTFSSLGAFPNGYGGHSEPLGVNDTGTVVGYSRATLRDNHAFASVQTASGRKFYDLGTLGGKNSAATAVNNNPGSDATIVGQMDNLMFGAHAFVTDTWRASWPVAGDLGTLGGKNSTALAVNDAGQIVGASNIHDDQSQFTSNTTFGSNEAVHAFVYGRNGMQDLGTLPGFQTSVAAGINNLGQIVGYASDAKLDLYHYYDATFAYGNTRAFLYEDGKLSDLNDLLPLDSGWILRTAIGINDEGQIVGSGLYHGEDRGYLFELAQARIQASPVPEPATLAMFGIIAAGAILKRRKHV